MSFICFQWVQCNFFFSLIILVITDMTSMMMELPPWLSEHQKKWTYENINNICPAEVILSWELLNPPDKEALWAAKIFFHRNDLRQQQAPTSLRLCLSAFSRKTFKIITWSNWKKCHVLIEQTGKCNMSLPLLAYFVLITGCCFVSQRKWLLSSGWNCHH